MKSAPGPASLTSGQLSAAANCAAGAGWHGGAAAPAAASLSTFNKTSGFDFVAGEGGDVVTLVQTVRGCDFRGALKWLADFAGVALGTPSRGDNRVDTDWAADLKWATWWARSAEMLAEWALEELPSCHADRAPLTTLLRTIRMGEAVLVDRYRAWRRQNPELTAALARAGQRSDARKQRLLSKWIANYAETTA